MPELMIIVFKKTTLIKDNSDNYTPKGEDNLDNLKIIDLIDA